MKNHSRPNYEKITELAFELWVKDGEPDGKAEEHWLKAEALLGVTVPKPSNEEEG